MKSILLLLSKLILILAITACGKKAQVNDKEDKNKNFEPSTAEVNFFALKKIERAIIKNDLPTLKKILTENPDIDLNQILNDGETFLIKAIKKDFRDIRNFLIEKKCDLERANVNKETPLLAAVAYGHINSVKVLLDNKVEIEKRNNDGNTALHLAIKKNNDKIALTLLKQGANIEAMDRKDRNAFKLAQEYNVPLSYEFIKTILKIEFGAPDIASFRNILNKADVKSLTNILNRYPRIVADYESINPLAILVDVKDKNSALQSAELLINFEANVNGPKDAEQTPLIRATVTEKKDFANLYLNANANPQLLDKDGKSALIHAVEQNNAEMVDLLLTYSAVEKYTFRRNGRKITYNACNIARDAEKNFQTEKEKESNRRIRGSLDCSFFRRVF